MAASINNMGERDVQSSSPSFSEFNLIISHVIGDKKTPPKSLPVIGIPQLPLTREEVFVHSVFESCTFKSTMSCVIGKIFTLIFIEGVHSPFLASI